MQLHRGSPYGTIAMQAVTSTSFSMPGTLLREAACNLRRGLVSGVGIEDCTMTPEERFWSNVDKTGGPDACWPWKLSTNTKRGGYGQAVVSRKVIRAHRAAYFFAYGDFDRDLHVCHRCDNPPCCNPAHLWLGTNAENRADSKAKGRTRSGVSFANRGEGNFNAKISAAIVLAIRGDTRTPKEIAAAYGISPSNVSMIRNRKAWKHVAETCLVDGSADADEAIHDGRYGS